MDITPYLHRINYHGPLEPNLQTLEALHEAHMQAVPFENLDIPLGRKITLDEAALFNKVVERRRGGFCYELNGLFAALLRELGFTVTMLSAGVGHSDGSFGPEFDHMALQVQLDEAWLADVGFGDSFRRPLRLVPKVEQAQSQGTYRIITDGDHLLLQQRTDDETWEGQYRFTLQSHTFSDYTDRCHYHQTSPDSMFTQQRICTHATQSGRVTLSDMRLIITHGKERQERLLADQDEYNHALREFFGIDLVL